MKPFKPMLCPNEAVDLSTLSFPLLASTKLDGIRCIFKDGQMLSRSLKPIRNIKLHEKFKALKEFSQHNVILDGEIYSPKLTFQEITHFVMSEETEEEIPNHLNFYCFDLLDDFDEMFIGRFNHYQKYIGKFNGFMAVYQESVKSPQEVNDFFEKALQEGYEGLILKDPYGKYKYGRGTIKEGLCFKVKPFVDFDAKIVSVFERTKNLVESHINELGRAQKHKDKDMIALTGIAGGFIVLFNGMEQKVTAVGTEQERIEIWNNRNDYIGKWLTFKGLQIGMKEGGLVRHPYYSRMRPDLDD